MNLRDAVEYEFVLEDFNTLPEVVQRRFQFVEPRRGVCVNAGERRRKLIEIAGEAILRRDAERGSPGEAESVAVLQTRRFALLVAVVVHAGRAEIPFAGFQLANILR